MRQIRRITWIICAIWIVGVLAVTVYKNVTTSDKASFTVGSDEIAFSGYTYVSDNSNGFGTIYKLSADGVTEKVYVTHRRKYIADWKILQLASDNTENQVGGAFYAIMQGTATSENYIPYRIVSFTSDLITDSMSTKFYLHSGLTVTGLSYDEGVIYITGITNSRQDVYIYKYNEGDLIRLEGINSDKKNELSATSIELNESSKERNPGGQLYTDAEYADGMLYTRIDAQAANEYFAEDTSIKSLFDNRTESFFKSLKATGMSFVDVIAWCLIGSVIIIFLFGFLAHRKYIIYRIIFAEGFVVVACMAAFAILAVSNHQAAVREFVRNEVYTLSLLGDNAPADMGSAEFYASAEYSTFYSNLNGIADRSDAMAEILDVAVVDSSTGSLVASTRGYGGGTVGYVYGEAARELVTSADRVGESEGVIDGNTVHFVSVAMSGAPQYRVLCVARLLTVKDYIMTYDKRLVFLMMLLFIVATAGTLTLIYLESMSMNRLGDALEKLGEGEEVIDIPEDSIGYDIKRMWAGINEIEKNLKRASHEKFMTYEAYFRFAPKKIEKILGKDIITEVGIGDTKRLNGTVALVRSAAGSIEDSKSLKAKNKLLGLIERFSEASGGIFVSAESDISIMKILFLDNSKESIRFGTDLAREALADYSLPSPTIILHYASFVYCVAGTDNQALTFLTQRDMSVLSDYAEWLGSLGVSMVVTEDVREREMGSWDFRYIGFIIPDQNDTGRRINFYEVLDAEDGEARRGKKKTSDAFGEALKMFYEKDFYFARNAFTDIIREVPEDEIAKWYLFECERLLNEEASADFAGELHIEG